MLTNDDCRIIRILPTAFEDGKLTSHFVPHDAQPFFTELGVSERVVHNFIMAQARNAQRDRPVTIAHPNPNTPIPAQIQKEITIMPNNVVSGAPLVLEFQKIFLRPSVLPESDITFTAADLSGWADAFWQSVTIRV